MILLVTKMTHPVMHWLKLSSLSHVPQNTKIDFTEQILCVSHEQFLMQESRTMPFILPY